jgi:hypothetical protein
VVLFIAYFIIHFWLAYFNQINNAMNL